MKKTARFRCRSCWHVETFTVREDGTPVFAPVCSHCISGDFQVIDPQFCDHDNVEVQPADVGKMYGDVIVDYVEMWEVCADCGEMLERIQ